jgi:hypothetical protein
MVNAGGKDIYLVSRDGSESTQYALPGLVDARDRDADGVPDDRNSCVTEAGAAPTGCASPAACREFANGVPASADFFPIAAWVRPWRRGATSTPTRTSG